MIRCFRWVVKDCTEKPVGTVVAETEDLAKVFLKPHEKLDKKIDLVEIFYNGSVRETRISEGVI